MINNKVTAARLVFYVEFQALYAITIDPNKDFIPNVGDIYWHDGQAWKITERHFNYENIKDKDGELALKIALQLTHVDDERYEFASRMDTNLTKDIIRKGG